MSRISKICLKGLKISKSKKRDKEKDLVVDLSRVLNIVNFIGRFLCIEIFEFFQFLLGDAGILNI